MSRATTTGAPAMQPATAAPTSKPMIPQERIAKLAYEKWVKGGCKHGCDKQNWLDAESELIRAETARNVAPSTNQRR